MAVTQDINQLYYFTMRHIILKPVNGCQQVSNTCGETPLYLACINKAELLLKHATTHDRCVDGRTCFHEVNEIAELFLLRGVTQLPDNGGRYPLHLALFVGNIEFARICAKYNVEH